MAEIGTNPEDLALYFNKETKSVIKVCSNLSFSSSFTASLPDSSMLYKKPNCLLCISASNCSGIFY